MDIATFSIRLAGRQARTEQNGTKKIRVIRNKVE